MKYTVINGHRKAATAFLEIKMSGVWRRTSQKKMPPFSQVDVEITALPDCVRVTSKPERVVTIHESKAFNPSASPTGGDERR